MMEFRSIRLLMFSETRSDKFPQYNIIVDKYEVRKLLSMPDMHKALSVLVLTDHDLYVVKNHGMFLPKYGEFTLLDETSVFKGRRMADTLMLRHKKYFLINASNKTTLNSIRSKLSYYLNKKV